MLTSVPHRTAKTELAPNLIALSRNNLIGSKIITAKNELATNSIALSRNNLVMSKVIIAKNELATKLSKMSSVSAINKIKSAGAVDKIQNLPPSVDKIRSPISKTCALNKKFAHATMIIQQKML